MTALLIEGAARVAAPARPLVTRDMLAAQLARLADWHVQVVGREPSKIGDRIVSAATFGLGGRARDFYALCDATETLADLADGEPVYGPHVDPDRADLLAGEAHADALAPLVDAAMTALRARGDCSICGAIYSGDHCPNCGWY